MAPADSAQAQSPQSLTGVSYSPFFAVKGRNGNEDPFLLPNDHCIEALNVDWKGAALGRRRGGSRLCLITESGTAFSSGVRFLARYIPTDDPAVQQGLAIDGAATPIIKHLDLTQGWVLTTHIDNISSLPGEANAVALDGKLFVGYDSTQNRLHVLDRFGANPTGDLRRAGIPIAAAGTVANTGAGAYAATIRYYRIRFIRQATGVTILKGELGPVVSFTPSGAGTAARVTRPTAPGEAETHWELFGSPDNSEFFSVAVVAVATTTYDDSAAPTSYNGDSAPDDGSYLPPPSARYLVTDDTRLIMGGAWESSGGEVVPFTSRIWWTPVKGTDVGDSERIVITDTIENFDDIDEPVTGISKPVQGTFFVFSYEGQWKFTGTGDVTNPYARFRVTGGQGCISHKSIVVASDETGYPATYWLSKRGPERSSRNGNEFCGADISDIWETVNLDASTLAHGVYHEALHQIWWYVATVASNTPDVRIVFDTWLGQVTSIQSLSAVRYGWAKHTGEAANAYCSCMMGQNTTTGNTPGRRLRPFIGHVGATGGSSASEVWECGMDSLTQDGSANYQAYIESRPMAPWGLGRTGQLVEEPMLIGKALAGVTIALTAIVDEGVSSPGATASLAPVSFGAAETRVFPQFDGAGFADAKTVRYRVGDAAVQAVATNWLLDAVVAPLSSDGSR